METLDTSLRVHKSSDVTVHAKLCRMLRSTLRRFPRAYLLNTQAAFGVSLDENAYMQVSYAGHWTPEVMRDCLALFATWLVVDPERLLGRGVDLGGVLRTVERESEPSSTRED